MYVAVYLALLGACAGYALLRGGAPERIGTVILGVAVAASEAVSLVVHPTFKSVELGYLVVDAITCGAFIALALRAQRFWPMYIAAILLNQVITHMLMLSPKVMPYAYSVMLAIWSFSKPPLLAIATWRHRWRMASCGADPSWAQRPRR